MIEERATETKVEDIGEDDGVGEDTEFEVPGPTPPPYFHSLIFNPPGSTESWEQLMEMAWLAAAVAAIFVIIVVALPCVEETREGTLHIRKECEEANVYCRADKYSSPVTSDVKCGGTLPSLVFAADTTTKYCDSRVNSCYFCEDYPATNFLGIYTCAEWNGIFYIAALSTLGCSALAGYFGLFTQTTDLMALVKAAGRSLEHPDEPKPLTLWQQRRRKVYSVLRMIGAVVLKGLVKAMPFLVIIWAKLKPILAALAKNLQRKWKRVKKIGGLIVKFGLAVKERFRRKSALVMTPREQEAEAKPEEDDPEVHVTHAQSHGAGHVRHIHIS
jgi:hypothetical protein